MAPPTQIVRSMKLILRQAVTRASATAQALCFHGSVKSDLLLTPSRRGELRPRP